MSLTEVPPRSDDFERTPPHDVAAEQCVLGGMLLSKRSWYLVSRMDPKTATPTVAPMERKNCVEAVAAPMCAAGATFCTTNV